MPILTYTNADFTAFTKIKSTDVNQRFTDLKTLLNTTGLDDANIQNAGITRATKLKLGTANHVLINDGTGAMSSEAQLAKSRGGTGFDLSTQPLELPEIASPANPASGLIRVFGKSDHKLYVRDSTGAEKAVGSGGGGINYISNPDAESGTTGWTQFSEAQVVTVTIASPGVCTVAQPHNFALGQRVMLSTTGALPTGLAAGTTYYVSVVPSSTTFQLSATLGGTSINTSGTQSGAHTSRPVWPTRGATPAGVTAVSTLTASATNPLRGATPGGPGQSFLVTKASGIGAGEGSAFDFTIDAADQGRMIQVAFDYRGSSAWAAGSDSTDSDIEVFLLDTTNLNLIPVTPYKLTVGNNNFGTFKGVFQTPVNSTTYRVILHIAGSNANAWTFQFDNVSVGPQSLAFGPAITDPVAYTPTLTSFGTVSALTAFYWREGKFLNVNFIVTAGTGAAALAKISLPAGLSVDTAAIANNFIEGQYSATASPFSGGFEASTSDLTNVYFTSGIASFTPGINGNTWASGTVLSGGFKVPISGWSSNTAMSADTDTRIISFTGTQSSQAVTASVTDIAFTTTLDRSGSWNGTQFTVPVAGDYVVSPNGVLSAGGALQVFLNGTLYGRCASASAASTTSAGAVLVTGCKAGDTLSVRCSVTLTVTTGQLGIFRLTGPATVAASESVNFSYRTAAGASWSAATATVINFDTKDFDSHNAVITGAGTPGSGWKFFAPTSGTYLFDGLVTTGTLTSVTAGQKILVEGYKNGVQDKRAGVYRFQAALSNTFADVCFTYQVRLNAGEYAQIVVTPDVAATGNTGSGAVWVSGQRIGN